MQNKLANEYIETFKKVYDISENHWQEKYFRPLENTIRNSTVKMLHYRLSGLKRYAKRKKIAV